MATVMENMQKRTLSQIFAIPFELLIKFYQRFISPIIGPRCKYYPTCSAYALRSLQVHGIFKGTLLTSWRILRCNPLSDGGVDHVPLRGEWKNPWKYPGSITEESYSK